MSRPDTGRKESGFAGHQLCYVCNIFRQRYILGDPYINSIFSSFKNMFDSPEDVRAMMYLKRIDSESIGSNPLDKLTRDIDHEIDLLE